MVTTNGNGANGGDAGLKIREKGDGSADRDDQRCRGVDNAIGGISVREDAAGNLRVGHRRARAASTTTGRGIDFDENGAGDLAAALATPRR